MKQLLLIVCLLSVSALSIGQTATSAANGNWLSPATWQGGVVPTPGYDVIINHNVTLGISWAYTSGSITINNGGSLSESVSDLGILITSQGSFVNNGTLNFSKMALDNCQPSSNTGIMQGLDSLYIDVDFINSGIINTLNLLTAASFNNNGRILGTNLLNTGSLSNADTIDVYNFYNNSITDNMGKIYFYYHTNAGTLNNFGTLIGSYDMHNKGDFMNYSGSDVFVAIDFSNIDTTNHDAYFYNESSVTVAGNFTNIDTLDGSSPGTFCIGQSSYNSGVMQGVFDFCDATPPVTPPYIDLNSGTIGAGITWCNTPCNVNIENLNESILFSIYPNPSESFFIENPFNETVLFSVYCTDGRLVKKYNILPSSNIIINDIAPGMYLYTFKGSKNFNGKIVKL